MAPRAETGADLNRPLRLIMTATRFVPIVRPLEPDMTQMDNAGPKSGSRRPTASAVKPLTWSYVSEKIKENRNRASSATGSLSRR